MAFARCQSMTEAVVACLVSVALVVVVASGCLLWIEVGGWQELRSAVRPDPDDPVTMMDDPVVMAAEKD